jgi:sugar transferase (PEP-CTERM system associated)
VSRLTRRFEVAADAVLLLASFFLAAVVRYGDLPATLSRRGIFAKAAVCSAVVLVVMHYLEIYERRARRRTELFLRLGQCMAIASIAIAVIIFLLPDLDIGRRIFVGFVAVSWLSLLLWRLLLLWTWGAVAALGDRVLILGTGVAAQVIAREMLKRAPVGYRILGFLTEHRQEVGRVLVNPSVVGTFDELPALTHKLDVSLIVVAQEDRRQRLPVDALLRCRMDGVQIVEATNLLESLSGRIPLRDLRPSWFIFSDGFSKPRLLSSFKRIGEAALSVAVLALAAPLFGLVALAVRLSSPGPVLYRQSRVGRQSRPFDLLKFRTMRQDAEAGSGPVWASAENDPRVTRVGRFLRKTRLDELPQLWNVLKGQMSFVGPRPERPHFVDKLRTVIPYYDERHGVRPGITGWAQVKFPYGSTIEDAEEKLEYDLYYVKHMSLLLDAAIVLETFKVMLLGRGR